ncbi:nucleotidyl transferase AbiEii/AbiGii toxin family protein [Roseofilum reptotaenium CS-1145]|uniref:nucleotidyl transferase AbiEii/AbiGii toxin family protein n=1 Tax=Roseofilum reptotaenium TaxID=1233427 RepID=UPI000AE1AC3B|nr:nucleotidyl transferase AbiEii/AbiGii toxin family protein [Roseofilum reptotaenium]MDB9517098.1 nucleotidyl transferase AbiEii/AbiGii toxin family protein [Roseofilum reptotaenium CS-1145]
MNGYPNTYPTNTETDANLTQAKVFEPALAHFMNAFRLGDPIFADSHLKNQWFKARREVMNHLLVWISRSSWNQHLVLRGSLLLKARLGDEAREPGDMDFVFRPDNISPDHPVAKGLFDDLIQMVSDNPEVGSVTIQVDQIRRDEIWTYERAEGRRIVFPWQAENLPGGVVQIDVTFRETLLDEPIQTSMSLIEGDNALIWSASPELSLAWKLLWLETDRYPQGKDLYDAVLLAERIELPFDLLHQVLQSSPDWQDFAQYEAIDWQARVFPSVSSYDLDWENFILEYPWIEGEGTDWLARLSKALAPTFSDVKMA